MTISIRRRAVLRGATSGVAAAFTPMLARRGLAQTVTLTQWQTNLRPPDIEGITKLIDRFHALNPTTRIRIEQTPWQTHNQRVLAAHSAGSGLPDVGRLGDVGQAANVGFVRPVDRHIDAAWRASLVPTAWADVTFPREGENEPRIWAIPKMLATEAWFYNKTMFREAGLDPERPPQTVDEFREAARKLTRDTNNDGRTDQWGVSLTAAAEGGPWRQYISAAKAFGGRLVASRYAESRADEAMSWNSPQTIAAMRWLVALYRDGFSPPSTPSDSVRDVANNFRAGRVAMSFMGPWEMAATREVFARQGWEFGVFRFPEGPAGRADFMYVGALGLFSQTQQEARALDYLRFYTSAEGLMLYMKTNGMIPANVQALADPYYAQDAQYRGFLETISSADLPMPKWMGLRGASAHFDSVWTPIYQRMLSGQLSVEDGVRQMHASFARFLRG